MSPRSWSALGIAVIGAVAFAFTTLNSGESTTVQLGFATLQRVPVSAVAFGGFVVGMLVILVAGVRSDLKVRRILKAGLVDGAEAGLESRVGQRSGEQVADRSADVPHGEP